MQPGHGRADNGGSLHAIEPDGHAFAYAACPMTDKYKNIAFINFFPRRNVLNPMSLRLISFLIKLMNLVGERLAVNY